ncbi:MAG: uroporphyrinogen-III synthase [Bacteroidota bacterium]
MTGSRTIVSTRKLASPTVEILQSNGCTLVQHDFISKVIHLPDHLTAASLQKNVVITSITGAKAFAGLLDKLQLDKSAFSVFCISRGTKEYATAVGFTIVGSAPHASALADVVLENKEVQSVTHICSNLKRGELSEKLSNSGVGVHDLVAYRTDWTPVKITPAYDGLIFFSPSAVDSFLSQNALHQVPCFCIGATTSDHAQKKGYKETIAAAAPSEEFLLKKLIAYYSKDTTHA